MMITSVFDSISTFLSTRSLPEIRTLVQFSHNELSYHVLFFGHVFLHICATFYTTAYCAYLARHPTLARFALLCSATLLYVITHNFRQTRLRIIYNIIQLVKTFLVWVCISIFSFHELSYKYAN